MVHYNKKNSTEEGNGRKNFPVSLHAMLNLAEIDGFEHIASWQPHGRSFRIHKHKEFMDCIMPKMFRQSKWSSFQRQVNLYGFKRITAAGPDKGAYYHESFLRGNASLAKDIARTRVKGTRCRMASNPEASPNFYSMPWVGKEPQDNCNEIPTTVNEAPTSEAPVITPPVSRSPSMNLPYQRKEFSEEAEHITSVTPSQSFYLGASRPQISDGNSYSRNTLNQACGEKPQQQSKRRTSAILYADEIDFILDADFGDIDKVFDSFTESLFSVPFDNV